MIARDEFEARVATLRAALGEKLGARGGSLGQALGRARRDLPKAARASGALLIEAEQKLRHPKIARQLDESAINKAFGTIEAHLKSINVKERRKDARLRWLAMLIVNLALLIALLVAVLRWQGLA